MNPEPDLHCALQGRFNEWWDVAGVQAGDTLSFRQEPSTGRIHVQRYQGAPPPVVTEQASFMSAWQAGKAA